MNGDLEIIGGADGPTAVLVSAPQIGIAEIAVVAAVVAVVAATVVAVIYFARKNKRKK